MKKKSLINVVLAFTLALSAVIFSACGSTSNGLNLYYDKYYNIAESPSGDYYVYDDADHDTKLTQYDNTFANNTIAVAVFCNNTGKSITLSPSDFSIVVNNVTYTGVLFFVNDNWEEFLGERETSIYVSTTKTIASSKDKAVDVLIIFEESNTNVSALYYKTTKITDDVKSVTL